MSVRLNKLLAQRGVGARRKCDVLIQQGFVRVNGEVVREPGTQVEPGRDVIRVEGRPLPAQAALRYYVLNKPVGVITTLDDPEGRRTIREFLPSGPRLFPVGRLDADTSGLLVLTNDGELAHRLMHPRYGVAKVYRVRVDRAPGPDALRRLENGVEFEPGVRSAPARVRLLSTEPGGALLRIELHEGRYRQVRRMCEAVGLAVLALHRSAYGPLRLGPVARGTWRELSEAEVSALRAASARPHWRGQRGYHGGRTGGEPARRLARRLQQLEGEEREMTRAPGPSPGRGGARRGEPRSGAEPRGRGGARRAEPRPGAEPRGRRGAQRGEPRSGAEPRGRGGARRAEPRPGVEPRGRRGAQRGEPRSGAEPRTPRRSREALRSEPTGVRGRAPSRGPERRETPRRRGSARGVSFIEAPRRVDRGSVRGASPIEAPRRVDRGSVRGASPIEAPRRADRGSSRNALSGRFRPRPAAPPEGRGRGRFTGQNPRRSGRGRSGRGPARGPRGSRRT